MAENAETAKVNHTFEDASKRINKDEIMNETTTGFNPSSIASQYRLLVARLNKSAIKMISMAEGPKIAIVDKNAPDIPPIL